MPLGTLTPAQVEAFHRDGFLCLDALTEAAEVERLQAIYDRLFAERVGRDEGSQFDLAGTDEEGKAESLPQILGPSRFAPELRETQFVVNAEAICRQLLGEPLHWRGDHAILKPARHGAPTPWHQDEAYWNPAIDYHAVSIWIPLQPATIENGCMWFIPGSHRWEVQPHHPINHDPRIHGLEIDEVDDSTAVACPIPAGGCTIHLSRTLHYTGPNQSDQPRRAYIIGFGTPDQPRAEPRNFYWKDQQQTPRMERQRQAAQTSDGAPH